MAGREYLLSLCRRVSRSTVVVALVAVCLAGASVMSWRQAAAERMVNGAAASSTANAVNAGSLISLNGREFTQSDGTQGAVVGEFEGYFDGKTRSFSLQPKGSGEGRSGRLFSRSDPSGEVAQGSGFSFRVVRSALITTGDNPATVTGEVELTNNTSATLYNTRIVFTTFKITNASGADAGNLPGANGFAYFNDGQVAYNNKLSVSREYGDIAASAKSSRVWTFAVNNQPPSFFFAYKVIADLGVATESVAPAAVQVNGSTGTSVTINGRGFSGTPTVELLPSSGSPIAATGVTATATSITATVPAGTAAGIYSVRVTNPGGTAGGAGSSTIKGRLTVTDVPSAQNTLTGSIPGGAFATAGAYLISGNATLASSTPIAPGTVIYVANGATITLDVNGAIAANGGIPGVSATTPAQIVFTSQRSPGAALPGKGVWGGIDARTASTANITMRNVVVEYAGGVSGAAINISGSGRALRFTDGVLRSSGGSGIAAVGGANTNVIGFSRNRVENNGTSATDPALLLSGDTSLGLFDIDSTNAATSVGDASYYYSAANDFSGNQADAVQIGTDTDLASNDFTKSGVLVGQGATPIRIRGNCANPAIVGSASGSPAELAIGPAATIQLAPDLNFQAGDYATNRVGCIAANGYGGAYLGPQAGSTAVNQLISFNKIPGGGNFGAIFFARNALANCILNYVSVQSGGANSACSLGAGEVIADAIGVKVTNSQVNNSASGGLLGTTGATIDSRGTTFSGNTPIIDTVAGGVLGDGNIAGRVSMVSPVAVATDPQGRGIYIVDVTNSFNLIRFINTTRSTATIGGQKIAAGAVRTVVGGGLDGADNISGRAADAGSVTGIAVSTDGGTLYYLDSGGAVLRALNTSNAAKTIGTSANVAPGNVATVVSSGFGSSLNALAVHPTSGEVYVGDATAGVNKIFKVVSGALTAVAGNGAQSKPEDSFSAGLATGIPLLQPRAITFDPQGNLYVADTGHARLVKVDAGGNATLQAQFPPKSDPNATPYNKNPFTTGLTFFNGKLYFANGNTQDIARIDAPGSFSTVSGTIDSACDYSSSNCGDAGPVADAMFNLIGSTGQPPLAGIAADSKGLFVLDQGGISRGRIRYINLSANPTEVAGVTIQSNTIDTIGGTGLGSPFDGGLASSAGFNTPTGVGVDANGNLWITDTLSSKLRFANLTLTNVTNPDGVKGTTIFPGTAAEQFVRLGGIATVNKDVGTGATDGVPVNQAGLDTPQGIAITAQGIFFADTKKGGSSQGSGARRTGLVRFINTTSQTIEFYSSGTTKVSVPPAGIATIAGSATSPLSDANPTDGPNPLAAKFTGPTDVAIHPTSGDIYVADAGNKRIRRIVRSTGVVSTILTGAANDAYTGLSFDSQGRLLAANAGTKTTAALTGNSSILREKSSGLCATTPAGCFDTILAGGTGSLLKNPRDVVEGLDGALYVTNAGLSEFGKGDHKILRIVVTGSTGTASIFAGLDEGYAGDGGPASSSKLNLTADDFNVATVGTAVNVRSCVTITISKNGEIYFTDSQNDAIRRIR